MKKKRITVVYSSHLSDEENLKFSEHISDTIGISHDIRCYPNHNEYSLPMVYNMAIEDYHLDDAIMVFCHNDIVFKTQDWGKLLLQKFNNLNYQIIGVAGTTNMPETGRWWEDRSKMLGIVEHTNGIRDWVSEYCKPFGGVKEVCLIDGVFMAVDTSDISNKFDEEFKGFHFYDLSFCIPNYLDGDNIGVITDIRILHKSVGMTNQQWEDCRTQFANKYRADLPINVC